MLLELLNLISALKVLFVQFGCSIFVSNELALSTDLCNPGLKFRRHEKSPNDISPTVEKTS